MLTNDVSLEDIPFNINTRVSFCLSNSIKTKKELSSILTHGTDMIGESPCSHQYGQEGRKDGLEPEAL